MRPDHQVRKANEFALENLPSEYEPFRKMLVPVFFRDRPVLFVVADPELQELFLWLRWFPSQAWNKPAPPRSRFVWNSDGERCWEQESFVTGKEVYRDFLLSKLVVVLKAYTPEQQRELLFSKPWLLCYPYDAMSRITYHDRDSLNCTGRNLDVLIGRSKVRGRRKMDRNPVAAIMPPFQNLEALNGAPVPTLVPVQEARAVAKLGSGLENVRGNLLPPVIEETPAGSEVPQYMAQIHLLPGRTDLEKFAKKIIQNCAKDNDPQLCWYKQKDSETEDLWFDRLGVVNGQPNWTLALRNFLIENPDMIDYWVLKLTQSRREQGLPDPSEQEALDLLIAPSGGNAPAVEDSLSGDSRPKTDRP